MRFLTFLKNLFIKKPVKIGLALGSGGAKGAAHLGALKAFEEEGIAFDVVAGTSIGAVVGAMYALKYTADDMIKIIQNYTSSEKISLLKFTLSKDAGEVNLLKLIGDKEFDDLALPFKCVACDLGTGDEIVLSEGSLAKAIASSSAIPPVFKPVVFNGKRLVDGAYVNAVPADVVKSMGADVVISVALHKVETNQSIVKYLDILERGHGVKVQNRLKGLTNSDYTLYPPLDEFTSSDIKHFKTMYLLGYECAKNHMDEIKATIKKAKKQRK